MNFIVNEFFLRRTENSFYLDRQSMFNKLLLKVLQLIGIVNRVERVVIFFMYPIIYLSDVALCVKPSISQAYSL